MASSISPTSLPPLISSTQPNEDLALFMKAIFAGGTVIGQSGKEVILKLSNGTLHHLDLSEALLKLSERTRTMSDSDAQSYSAQLPVSIDPIPPFQIDVDALATSLGDILSNDSRFVKLLGVKLWTALHTLPEAQEMQHEIIAVFPDIIPLADTRTCRALSRIFSSIITKHEQNELFIDTISVETIAFVALDILSRLPDKQPARKFWLKRLPQCRSIEFTNHHIGLQMQERLSSLTWLNQNSLNGLLNIPRLCLTSHYHLIPLMLERVHQEHGLSSQVLPSIDAYISLLEHMFGGGSLPLTVRLDFVQNRTLVEYVNDTVNSLFKLAVYDGHPLKASTIPCDCQPLCLDHVPVDPLDVITRSPLSASLIHALTSSLSQHPCSGHYLANMLQCCIDYQHESHITEYVAQTLAYMKLSHSTWMRLLQMRISHFLRVRILFSASVQIRKSRKFYTHVNTHFLLFKNEMDRFFETKKDDSPLQQEWNKTLNQLNACIRAQKPQPKPKHVRKH